VVDAATESIAQLEQALVAWSHEVKGLWATAGAQLRSAGAGIDRECADRANRVSALEQMLAAAGDEQEAARLRALLLEARDRLARARKAQGIAYGAQEMFTAARRRSGSALEPALESARENLKTRLQSLDAYVRSGTGGGPAGGGAGRSAPAVDPMSTALRPLGLQMVDLAEVDYSDNPIVGDFGRGGAKVADYRWAVETWDTVVAPGVARNQGRDGFAERDGGRDAPAFRRTADVYDMFLGNDAITLSRRPNGTYDVIGGRHRIEVARRLGIDSLPARVLG
jgi:hypothetical protein